MLTGSRIFLFLIVYSANCYNIIFNIGSTGLLLPYTMGSLGYIKKNVKIDNYDGLHEVLIVPFTVTRTVESWLHFTANNTNSDSGGSE